MIQRIFMVFLMLCGFASNSITFAANPTADSQVKKVFIEGKHYVTLAEPLPGNIAPVMEFMYFGCKACYQLVPSVADWSHSTGIAVALSPAHSDTTMLDEARMFHTFDQMGVLGTMYELGYVIFQTQENKLQGEARVNSYLERHKVDQKKFWEVWKSEEVNRRIRESALLTKQAGIHKTPTFVVHGKYRIDIESLTSVEELFELLEYLVKEKPLTPPSTLQKPNI